MLKPMLLLALAFCSAPLLAEDAAPATPAVTLPAVVAAPGPLGAPEAKPEPKPLKMGDAAPELKLGRFYKGGPVTLEADKTYIVECWATWCGPCVAAFPHLSELADEFKDKITVVGVNVWERQKPDAVKAFVDKQGDKMKYNVAEDGNVATDWLKAAGKNGIPCAFVVSKGKVMWIGHPGQLNKELLQSVLDGKLDIAALAKAEEAQQAAGNYFMKNVVPSLRKNDFAGAIAKLEDMKKEFPGEAKTIDMHIARMKQMQQQLKEAEAKPAEAKDAQPK